MIACVVARKRRTCDGSVINRCLDGTSAAYAAVQVVGFSGTVDNRSLLPLQVEMHDTGVKSIRGTNGRMISTMLLPGKCTFVSLDQHVPAADTSNTPVSMQVLQFAVDQGANAIIDAGVLYRAAYVSVCINEPWTCSSLILQHETNSQQNLRPAWKVHRW